MRGYGHRGGRYPAHDDAPDGRGGIRVGLVANSFPARYGSYLTEHGSPTEGLRKPQSGAADVFTYTPVTPRSEGRNAATAT